MFIIRNPDGSESDAIEVSQLRLMIRNGEISPQALARKQSAGEWRKICSYSEFFAIVSSDSRPPIGTYSMPPFPMPAMQSNPLVVFMLMDGQKQPMGPYTIAELKAMLKEGTVSHHTQTLREGQDVWRELGSLPEFLGMARSNTSPPFGTYASK